MIVSCIFELKFRFLYLLIRKEVENMKVLKNAKVKQIDFAQNTDKVTINAAKPCNERDLSCNGMISYAPPR